MLSYPTVGFIGAGKTGRTLGRYFYACGLPIFGYFSRQANDAQSAADFTGSGSFGMREILAGSDILFLTVPDGEIENVWNQISAFDLYGKTICHCSGMQSSEIFADIGEKGAIGYSFHPVFAISNPKTAWQVMGDVHFTIEGTGDSAEMRALVRQIGNPVYPIDPAYKVRYHAACVFLSNFIVGLAKVGSDLFLDCGLDAQFAQNAWHALFLENAKHVVEDGVAAALTGPVERGDDRSVDKHLNSLQEPANGLYRALSLELLKIAKEKHPQREFHEMESLLRAGGESI